MTLREDTIEAALEEALGQPAAIEERRAVGGGCINNGEVVQTVAGSFFVKWNRHPIADQFEREAESLEALIEANSPLRIPRPIAHRRATADQPAFLILEYLEPGAPIRGFDEALGQGLAALHAAGDEQRFGFGHDNYCGVTPQPNPWHERWIPFFREHRLRHQIRLADERRGFSTTDRQTLEGLADRLDDLLAADPEPPALIHGDLWSGNLHRDADGQPALIDPAAYFAHREMEFGMTLLFGGLSGRVYRAYDEAHPLQPGWRDRGEIYTIYHILNHYTLFGGGYGAQAVALARRFA